MTERERLIAHLEDENSELAKEVLLNESAIYEAERLLKTIDTDLINHPVFQDYTENIKASIEKIESENRQYRVQIYKNNFEIKYLNEDGESGTN
ncbi:MAG: hypothetical protein EAZ70_07205 [Runella slithyformis]|jgi:hypothetical protein|nr:MAG: hypothetical protein EAY79_06170 [Runella slithyformis]TAF97418.1 MAG: hypothetical protein EAZ46_02255 [Runella sp.]TAG22215.1 MAG: hypothetical protein EAZ38_06345 [Cytophagales bacterium]TAG41304.1 MAG: hypothetical protein EAZ32_03550 [Cytophagia bacterium]TAF27493.1 MAG: hypothetical protein EAZ70_07205 [Runella slithyformis]